MTDVGAKSVLEKVKDLGYDYAEFQEAIFFPVDIFSSSNRLFDSVSDAESHNIKILS